MHDLVSNFPPLCNFSQGTKGEGLNVLIFFFFTFVPFSRSRFIRVSATIHFIAFPTISLVQRENTPVSRTVPVFILALPHLSNHVLPISTTVSGCSVIVYYYRMINAGEGGGDGWKEEFDLFFFFFFSPPPPRSR